MAQRVKPKAKQQTQQSISIKGSVKICTEFFEFGLSSILYQRNLYPPDDFKMVKRYGLNMLVPSDDSLRLYIQKITDQLGHWLEHKQVSRLVLAIIDKDTRDTVERWQFDITLEDSADINGAGGKENEAPSASSAPVKPPAKVLTDEDIRTQIQAVIKNICASNAFLPILENPANYTFNVLAYTDIDTRAPAAWSDSDAHLISGGGVEHVKLRSFATNHHRVEGMVAYRLGEEA